MELDLTIEDTDIEEVVDITLDIDGKVMPTKHDKIALIDADTIAFTACLSTEVGEYQLGEDFHTDEEWAEIIMDKQYVEEENVIYTCDIAAAVKKSKEKINRILDKTGCVEFELHFTGGRENFRYDITKDAEHGYKANRTTRAPAGLGDTKKALCELYGGLIHTKYEADDAVVHIKKNNPDKYILVALDKDVINSVEGEHFNYYESRHYNIEMKWHKCDRYTAILWPFVQTLTGDKTDNVIAIKGIGPAKADKALAGKFTKGELWDAVVYQYKKAGKTEADALLNYNLVSMHLLQDDGTIKLQKVEDFYAN